MRHFSKKTIRLTAFVVKMRKFAQSNNVNAYEEFFTDVLAHVIKQRSVCANAND